MTSLRGRFHRIALCAAAGVAGLVMAGAPAAVAAPGPALPDSPGTCSGVWVIVDASALKLNAPVTRGCARPGGTGLDALTSAGFSYTANTSGLLTSIGGLPSDRKVLASHYWSYWHATANADGTWSDWSYSQLGAGTYRPAKGSAEGWRFINEDTQTPPAPGAKPPKVTKPTQGPSTTKAPSTTQPPAASGGSSTKSSGTNASTSSARASSSATAPSTAALPDSTASGTTGETTSSTDSPTSHILSDGPASTDPGSGSGSGGAPWALLGTLGVVVLGGGGLGLWWFKIGRFR